jgi:hypothetical protein
MTDQPIAYTNNGILLCLACVERFDLTNPDERDPHDEFLPVSLDILKANVEVQGPMHCNSPACGKEITTD